MSTPRDEPIRFGIVGCGVVAPTHAVALDGIVEAKLIAVADASRNRAETFAKEFRVPRVYNDYRELLQDPEIDAVTICTPHHLHAPIAIAAAQHGKHVLVEKPMATSLEDADRMIAACERAGVRLGVVFQHRFDPAVRYVKRLVEEGDLGRIALASVYVKWFRTQDYYDPDSWRGKWATAGGGALINQAIHAIDVLLWIMGDVERLSGYYDALVHAIEVEDTAVASLRFVSGALGVVEASTTTYPQTPERIEIAGSRGTVAIAGEEIVRHELAGRGADIPDIHAGDPRFRGKSYYGASHPRLVEDFVHALLEGRPPLVDGHQGRRVLEVIFGIYESCRTGREVVLRPKGEGGSW
ncbi:MAG: oxidoreductase [Candidatus Poribacteria bacterium]|nr:MAG: oxidoreductase [Candidatus Poribacteria bacterium]